MTDIVAVEMYFECLVFFNYFLDANMQISKTLNFQNISFYKNKTNSKQYVFVALRFLFGVHSAFVAVDSYNTFKKRFAIRSISFEDHYFLNKFSLNLSIPGS